MLPTLSTHEETSTRRSTGFLHANQSTKAQSAFWSERRAEALQAF
ncbi:hypothetical protein [Alkalicoccus chagannorensis]|nr:hypothetical protein [Alkalicoccus chagannorensis]